MKIKLGDALNVNITIKAILENSQIDTALKFQLLMIGNALQPVMANYDMLRNQKIAELGKQSESEDENGNKNIYIPSDDKEAIEKFNTAMESLLNTEITIACDKLKAADVFDKGIPVDYLIALCKVIEM